MSTTQSEFTPKDKAFYADEAWVSFVRPGLVFQVQSHVIAQDGTVTVRFKMTDPRGLPLDREGIMTPGTVSSSFVLARIPKNGRHYQSYTTRLRVSNLPETLGQQSRQAAADAGGQFARVGEGEYTYTFATKLPGDYPRNATHAIAVYGSRDLSEFDLGVDSATTVYKFVPDGSEVVDTREVIAEESCNACHTQVASHGGARVGLEVCLLCHTPGYGDVANVNPQTGNVVDMAVMAHKIHRGAELPSVLAGTPYRFVASSVHDYSDVRFPAGTSNCGICHGGEAKDGASWLRRPTRAACGACHDDVNFTTGERHLDLPQVSDDHCPTCHFPEGEVEFDASIKGAHILPTRSAMVGGVVAKVVGVENAKPGQKPVVSFTLEDRKGLPLTLDQLGRYGLVISGPTSDYVSPGPNGYLSETPSNATLAGNVYRYTFNTALPEAAKGSYTVSIEANRLETVLVGTTKERTITSGSPNSLLTFSVDGSEPVQRRAIVDTVRCNSCHDGLAAHSERRNNVKTCVLCHNPVLTDAARRPAAEQPGEGLDFALLIHRLHAGKAQIREYTVWASAAHNYNKVGFPKSLAECEACHLPGTYRVPVEAVANKTDPRGWLNPVAPTSAACLGCHTSIFAASHALVNTSALGESCATCHGLNRSQSVDKVHAR